LTTLLYDFSYRDKYFLQNLEIIRAAYEKNSGNISAIAREINIFRNRVYKKLKEARKVRLDV